MLRRTRLYLLGSMVILFALTAPGCDWFANPSSSVGGGDYSVRATVLSHTNGAPINGAYVKVVETGSTGSTNSAGQTPWLLAPRNVDRCTLYAWYGQINLTVTVGLSRNPNNNQPVLYLTSKVPVPLPAGIRPDMIPTGGIFVPDGQGGGLIVEVREN